MSVTDEKKSLRKSLIQCRRQMSPEVKAAADERIFEQLLPVIEKSSSVFTYVSTDIEVDTMKLLEWCFEHGKPVGTPVSGDTELTFYPVKSFEELSSGKYGISEPVNRTSPLVPDERSVCIVPALCCDRTGLRLGYGRGYYDRFLTGFPGKAVIICYSEFVMNVPHEPHDRRADMVITD